MCTVTFIPFKDKIFITSNRDESPERKAKGLTSLHPPGKNIIHYPLDDLSGGSWIALSDEGRAVCLLNGAYESFTPNPPYRQSRGQVVIDAVHEVEIRDFLENYPFEGIAPFTILIFEKNVFFQLVWDGEKKQISELSIEEPQIWSSATLYPLHIRNWRKSLFEKWLNENQEINRESIIQFHQMANGDPDNDFIMNRNDIVKTLSITSIELRPRSASILHLELDPSVREEILVKYG
jgi:uncharacterized protein with NRDE domain